MQCSANCLSCSISAIRRTFGPWSIRSFTSLTPTFLADDSTVALYVAAILARRLDTANQALIEVKRQLQAGDPRSVISRAVDKVEQLLSSGGGVSLAYAGYPYDPFALR